MRALFGAFVVLVVGLHVALAAPRKVLVLPIDGSVDPALRARLNTQVLALAKNIDGKVSAGDATFDETAAALGCDREAPACAESVRATLNVDELVYGRATTTGDSTTLVVRRVRSKTAYREGISTFASTDESGNVESELSPLFDIVAPEPEPVADVAPVVAPVTPVDRPTSSRTRGIMITAGGGAALVIGLVLWANVHGTQGEIDDANPQTEDDFRALEDKEDKAQRNAIIGDVLVVAGLGLTAWGAWTIYTSGDAEVTVAPTVNATGGGVAIGGRW